MKKRNHNQVIIFMAATACLASVTSSTFAASVNWVGADVISWTYSPDEVDNASATTGKIRAGIEYSDYFGVETHIALGGSDKVTVNDTKINVGLDHVWGVFFSGKLPYERCQIIWPVRGKQFNDEYRFRRIIRC